MADNAYFSGNPTRLDISRSRMTAQPRWTGNWNVGELVPIFARQVLPGETMSLSVASAVRMITPVVPVMDDMDITIEAFYVPNRLLLSRRSMSPDLSDANYSWQAFIGAQDSVLNVNGDQGAKLPAVIIDRGDTNSYVSGSLADCLGFPPSQGTASAVYRVNCLKPLAYYSIWNEYFREPNVQVPVTFAISYGDVTFTGTDANIPSGGTSYIARCPLANVSRYHGYFGSCLPWPQRNSATVQLPLGALAPVITGSADIPDSQLTTNPLGWKSSATPHVAGTTGTLWNNSGGSTIGVVGTPGGTTQSLIPANLYADLSQATAASVNQFRLAVQTQRWYEALGRSGNKYPDLLAGMFDVVAPNVSTRPEYLGGFTAPIQMSQVAQTADLTQSGGATGNQGLGRLGAFSLSNPGGFLFTKSFTEHGIVMVVMCCRVKESFSQGVNREDSRRDRFEFYWPQFANLGEQPVLVKELYVTGNTGVGFDDKVFGYQEAWAEERMIPDITTGHFRAGGDMQQWTYVNNFAGYPTLKGYLNAKNQVDNVDKTIAVSHSTAGFQLFGQFQFDITMVKPMPLYSIPGLVDHH